MLSCEEISKLVSQSMDRDLPFRQRMQVFMHLAMCRFCGGFSKQLKLLRVAMKRNARQIETGETRPAAGLSDESRERIKTALRNSSS